MNVLTHTLILHGGGLRSLVATALALEQDPRGPLTLLHIDDGRAAEPRRLDHLRRQAEHFRLDRGRVLTMGHLFSAKPSRDATADPQAPAPALGMLAGAGMLLAALAQARGAGAQRVVYPVACDATADPAAQAVERAELCSHLAQSEDPAMPRIELPLVELSDQQVLELGARLEVPWALAWSCRHAGEGPCGSCEGCGRRARAFGKAGLVDPSPALGFAGGAGG